MLHVMKEVYPVPPAAFYVATDPLPFASASSM
jgi:hypothetical protein